MTTFKNEFSWSISRDDIFRKCHRMYYFQYYGSWGGWDTEADDRTRMIYILKQLQNRHVWAGNMVHECIENTIKTIKDGHESLNMTHSIDETLARMRQEFRSSKNKTYLVNPKTCALYEHEYDLAIPETEWKHMANHVEECLKQFFNSAVYKEILQISKNQWLELEQFPYFYWNDVKIYASLDFAFRRDDEIIIYDWKTGREEPNKDKFQLACYGLFAVQKWGSKAKNVKLIDYFLSNGKQNEYRFVDFRLDQINDYILNSIDEMKRLLDDPQDNIAREDFFPFTDNEPTCQYCNYSKICPKFAKST